LIERLIGALIRVVGVEAVAPGPDRVRAVGMPGLEFVGSRPLGGAWLLDGLWLRLGIDWTKGNAGVICIQILPFADPTVLDLLDRFENAARTL
jgi:hypothetical protein